MRLNYIFIACLFLQYACSKNTCVNEQVIQLKKETGFDYFEFTANFEIFLLKENLLQDNTAESYLSLFRNNRYCEINYNNLINSLDNSLATSPTIGGAYIECGLNQHSIFQNIEIDSLINNPNSYVTNMLTQVKEVDFQKKENKAFFIYQINVLMGSCEN